MPHKQYFADTSWWYLVVQVMFHMLVTSPMTSQGHKVASIWPKTWKDRPKLCQQSIFYGDDVINDVTGCPQIRPPIFIYNWNKNIIHDNSKRINMLSLNLLYKCILRSGLYDQKSVLIASYILLIPGNHGRVLYNICSLMLNSCVLSYNRDNWHCKQYYIATLVLQM